MESLSPQNSNHGYQIVPATIHDIFAIDRIDKKAFKQWPGDSWGLKYLVTELSRRDLRVTVAREGFGNQEVIGFMVCDQAAVLKVAVGQPRRGIGRALLMEWVQAVNPVNIGTMIRHKNEASTGLFGSCGFRLTSGFLSNKVSQTWGWWVINGPTSPVLIPRPPSA
jgi:ribosomal protein S18 acetylase RimI-like enzyme